MNLFLIQESRYGFFVKKTVVFCFGVLCLLFSSRPIFAQNNIQGFDEATFPDSLLKGADIIYLFHKTKFVVLDPGKARHEIEYRMVVLNRNGLEKACNLLYYNKGDQLTIIKASIYDSKGYLIRKIKKEEIIDRSAVDNTTLIDDSRMKIINPINNEFPYIVDLKYEFAYNGITSYPSWAPLSSEKTSFLFASFELTHPLSIQVNIKAQNLSYQSYEKGDTKIIYAKCENIKSNSKLDFQLSSKKIPLLLFNSSKIRFGKYEGSNSSWKDIGEFYYTINRNRDILSEEIINKIKGEIAGIKSEKEMVRVLYQYLQNNTRYVSIQLGIGGWQCIEAEKVHKYAYGDCKALTNYMMSMLKYLGITSYPVLVNSGRNPEKMDPAFAHDYFDHVILVVPLAEADTIWLECTSKHLPMNYLGSFTDNRYALLVKQGGSVLLKTPNYFKNNFICKNAEINLFKGGGAKIKLKATYSNLEYDKIVTVKNYYDEEQKTKWLRQMINVEGLKINDYRFDIPDNNNPLGEILLNAYSNNFLSITDKRIIFIPNIFSNNNIPSPENVEIPFQLKEIVYFSDTINIVLPDDIGNGNIQFAERELDNLYGSYKTILRRKNSKELLYIRQLKLKGTENITDKCYLSFIEFMKNISDWDTDKIVIERTKD